GGQRIFIFTGLLLRAQTLNQVAGVLAHETGHIAGGHLVRSEEAIRQATALQIAGLLLGIAAAAAGGGGAGMGLVMGGQ
ncbi:M48 family metalloprotease, partial [Acinetobacter baumannii]